MVIVGRFPLKISLVFLICLVGLNSDDFRSRDNNIPEVVPSS